MAFTNDQVGMERGATQFLAPREPRIMNRFQSGGPARAQTKSLTGSQIVVEYLQDIGQTDLVLRWEHLTAAQITTIRSLLDAAGIVVVKIKIGVATTYNCMFDGQEEPKFEPLIGHYPESAPAAITRWRAEIPLRKVS
jgi:hypothetical protein